VRSRRIVVLAFPGVQALDVVGPLEVFGRSTRLLEERGVRGGYRLEIAAERRGPVRTSSGFSLLAERRLDAISGPIDTLLVPGGIGVREVIAAGDDAGIVRWLQKTARRARRLCSVCTGAFILAEAGLLDGRRATTHWRAASELARQYPKVEVDPDPIFIRQGRVLTSAGVTAGMDLALALVEEDHGRELSLEVARELVMFLRRPGGQSQFSVQLSAQLAEKEPLRELQRWILDHLGELLTVERLAARVHMSPRNFARVFLREVGMTPARFVQKSRVEAARRLLEESREPIEAVALGTGFGTAESMRRAFVAALGTPPARYRERFARDRDRDRDRDRRRRA
jgi:transcriptional regulator GlxA family with amidase domain